MRIRFLVLTLLTVSILPAAAQVSPPPAPTFAKFLRMLGAPGIPAEWAGIWQYADTTRMCDSTEVEDVETGFDTLCMDQQFDPDTSQAFNCTGTATSTSIDITCIGYFTLSATCTDTITYQLQGTRTGETATYVQIVRNNFSRPGCPPIPDSCERTSGVRTRIGPAPKTCNTTPAQRSSWGRVKAHYR